MKHILFLILIFIVINSCFVKEVLIKRENDIEPMKYSTPINFLDDIYIIETDRGTIIRKKDEMINFGVNSSIVYDKYLDIIYIIKDFLDKNEQVSLIVEGHADENGGANIVYDNIEISRKRSLAVINILTNMGIDENRLKSYYFGDFLPYYTNTKYNTNRTSRNRRVEFILISSQNDYIKYTNTMYEILYKTKNDDL